ncbi:hypothetical protein L0M92_13455, partial [Casaltella massiliensis]|nr:hypothetical protein [Casaltella massiliensis]
MTAAIHVMQEDGNRITQFYTLKLEITKISSLALSWTVVHALNEESPLHNITERELREGRIEVILNIKGFDD